MGFLKNVFCPDDGYIWLLPGPDPESYQYSAMKLSKEFGLSARACQILVRRFKGDFESARMFLEEGAPEIELSRIPGMDQAVKIILDCRFQDAIGIYSDFDADGVTSAVILEETLSFLGIKPVMTYFPSRFRHGYGFHADAVEEMVQRGVKVIITSDCGITGHRAVEVAKQFGCKVIITDHHRPKDSIPDAEVVLDPFLPSWGDFDLSYLSGAGVAWLLCRALLREKGVEEEIHEDFPYDLLTLSVAGDGQALIGLNRIFVKKGLKSIARGQRPGIRGLLSVSRGIDLSETVLPFSKVEYERDVMFGLVPRINAAGRMDSAYKAFFLLRETDLEKAIATARELDQLNSARRREEDCVLTDCAGMFSHDKGPGSQYVLCAQNPAWHQGVIGIAASKLRESHHRPAVLLSGEGDVMKGSVRGIPGLNIHKALSRCEDLLVTYGGHEGAGGLSIERKNVEAFFERFVRVVRESLLNVNIEPSIDVDDVIPVNLIDEAYLKSLSSFGPFGQGNPLPCLVSKDLSIEKVRLLGQNNDHLEIWVKGSGKAGKDISSPPVRFIFFQNGKRARDVALWANCDVLFSFREEEHLDQERYSLIIKDIRPALSMVGSGYQDLFMRASRGLLEGPAILYTWSFRAARSIYVALSKMGIKVAFHSRGRIGAQAHESRLVLSEGGLVVSDAPWDIWSDGEKDFEKLSLPPRLILVHAPLEREDQVKLAELWEKGLTLEPIFQGDLEEGLSCDSREWMESCWPGKESMEIMWRLLKKISVDGVVFPWELGKNWQKIAECFSRGTNLALYDKTLALIDSSLSILEELSMISWNVYHKILCLRLSEPKNTVSLRESRLFSKGEALKKMATTNKYLWGWRDSRGGGLKP